MGSAWQFINRKAPLEGYQFSKSNRLLDNWNPIGKWYNSLPPDVRGKCSRLIQLGNPRKKDLSILMTSLGLLSKAIPFQRGTNMHTRRLRKTSILLSCSHENLNYRPRSRGDNTFGSVRVFVTSRVSGRGYKNGAVCLSVCVSVCLSVS